MLDEKDIQKLIKTFPTREEAVMKKDFDDFRNEMRGMFSDLQTSVDAYAKKADTYFQEIVVLNNNYRRLEGWIHLVAEKVGVELKY
jgi:hypothetical protein